MHLLLSLLLLVSRHTILLLFFFNEPTTTQIYTLSLHDALPISSMSTDGMDFVRSSALSAVLMLSAATCVAFSDRKSTRLNSSHVAISYAVFCLKKKIQDERQGE